MFINENKKKGLKFKILGLTSVLGIASLSTVIATSCSPKKTTTNDVATPIAKASTKTPALQAYQLYSTVSFVNGGDSSIRFVGDTTVKVKTGYVFGAVNPPTPVKAGFALSQWLDASDNPITDTTPITADITLHPVMVPTTTELSIEGPDTIYDGIHASVDTGYTYHAIMADAPTTPIVWTTSTAGVIEFAPVTTDTTFCKVIPLTTTEIKSVDLTATYTIAGTVLTDTITITVKPPFYCGDSVQIGGVEKDLGSAYWCLMDTGAVQSWYFAFEETLCDPDSESTALTFYYPTITAGVESYTSVTSTRTGETTLKNNLSEMYPGCELGSIAPYFMAGVTDANPELHGGIHEITKIGEGFLLGFEDFNQSINSLFTTIVPIQIDKYFMLGCTAFNNGAAEGAESALTLPNALVIGDGFMNDCSALYAANISLPTNARYIGRNFMSDCPHITGVTFGAGCTYLDFVGTSFMSNCDALATITIGTGDVDYLEDMRIENSASFTKTTAALVTTPTTVAGAADVVDTFLYILPDKTTAPYRNLEPAA